MVGGARGIETSLEERQMNMATKKRAPTPIGPRDSVRDVAKKITSESDRSQADQRKLLDLSDETQREQRSADQGAKS